MRFFLMVPVMAMCLACEKQPTSTPSGVATPAGAPAPSAAAPATPPAAEKAAATETAPAPTAQDAEAAAAKSAEQREGLSQKRALFDEEKATRSKLAKDKERAAGDVKDFLE